MRHIVVQPSTMAAFISGAIASKRRIVDELRRSLFWSRMFIGLYLVAAAVALATSHRWTALICVL